MTAKSKNLVKRVFFESIFSFENQVMAAVSVYGVALFSLSVVMIYDV